MVSLTAHHLMNGVVVTGMSPGYPSAKAELAPGDVIVAVNQNPVADLDAFQKMYDESVKKQEPIVPLEVVRNRGHQLKLLKLTYAK